MNQQEIMSVLFLSKIFLVLTYTNEQNQTFSFLNVLIYISISTLLLLVFMFFLYKINKGKRDFLSLVSTENTVLSKVNLSLIILFFSVYIAQNSVKLISFTTGSIYKSTDFLPLAVLFFAIIGYSLYSGLSGVAKASVIIQLMFVIFIIVLGITSVYKMNMGELLSISELNKENYVQRGVSDLLLSYEVICVLFFVNKCDTTAKLYFSFIIKSFVVSVILFALLYITFGNFFSTQEYPFFALSMSENISIFQRIDGFFIVVWSMLAFVRISMLSLCVLDIAEKIFKNKKFLPIVLPIIFLVITLILNQGKIPEQILNQFLMVGFVYIVTQFIWVSVLKPRSEVIDEKN